jgi:hypothetical protein
MQHQIITYAIGDPARILVANPIATAPDIAMI